jgi:hypothetical protein
MVLEAAAVLLLSAQMAVEQREEMEAQEQPLLFLELLPPMLAVVVEEHLVAALLGLEALAAGEMLGLLVEVLVTQARQTQAAAVVGLLETLHLHLLAQQAALES